MSVTWPAGADLVRAGVLSVTWPAWWPTSWRGAAHERDLAGLVADLVRDSNERDLAGWSRPRACGVG